MKMSKITLTDSGFCVHPDDDLPFVFCGHPLPCPYHPEVSTEEDLDDFLDRVVTVGEAKSWLERITNERKGKERKISE